MHEVDKNEHPIKLNGARPLFYGSISGEGVTPCTEGLIMLNQPISREEADNGLKKFRDLLTVADSNSGFILSGYGSNDPKEAFYRSLHRVESLDDPTDEDVLGDFGLRRAFEQLLASQELFRNLDTGLHIYFREMLEERYQSLMLLGHCPDLLPYEKAFGRIPNFDGERFLIPFFVKSPNFPEGAEDPNYLIIMNLIDQLKKLMIRARIEIVSDYNTINQFGERLDNRGKTLIGEPFSFMDLGPLNSSDVQTLYRPEIANTGYPTYTGATGRNNRWNLYQEKDNGDSRFLHPLCRYVLTV